MLMRTAVVRKIEQRLTVDPAYVTFEVRGSPDMLIVLSVLAEGAYQFHVGQEFALTLDEQK
jgi:hypothetical protein